MLSVGRNSSIPLAFLIHHTNLFIFQTTTLTLFRPYLVTSSPYQVQVIWNGLKSIENSSSASKLQPNNSRLQIFEAVTTKRHGSSCRILCHIPCCDFPEPNVLLYNIKIQNTLLFNWRSTTFKQRTQYMYTFRVRNYTLMSLTCRRHLCKDNRNNSFSLV